MAASPCKGETFIAKSYLIMCWRSVGARCVELLRKSFPIHFAPNGASSASLLVAINISLRWSENDFSQLHLKVESILKVLANFSRPDERFLPQSSRLRARWRHLLAGRDC